MPSLVLRSFTGNIGNCFITFANKRKQTKRFWLSLKWLEILTPFLLN